MGDLLLIGVIGYASAVYIFNGPYQSYYAWAFLIFTAAIGVALRYLLSRLDLTIEETRLKGQKLTYPNGDEFIVAETSRVIWQMPRDQRLPLWSSPSMSMNSRPPWP